MSGFSAGAFFIQGFTYHYPQYVNGLSILSAGVYLNPRMFINLIPMTVVIGDADHPDAVQASSIFASNLQKFGFDVQYTVLPGVGHVVTKEGVNLTIELFRKTTGK
jgi:predicted esterase